MSVAVVIVVTVDGSAVDRLRLAHGQHVDAALAAAGYVATELAAIGGHGDPHEIVIDYRARPIEPGERPPARAAAARVDAGLSADEVRGALARQRIAAYAVVRSDRGVLLTELSDRTNSPGRWTLPGGGLDPGEAPADAVHREVWEESGQQVSDLSPARVESERWVGRAPSGHVEDFHAVRLVYRARCLAPTEPVVHDVGGTTWAADWFSLAQARSLPLTRTAAIALDTCAD